MIPLEMKGMIRRCHPTTPLVGLHRQSGDPTLTKYYYNIARVKRDIVCFPSMLRKITQKCRGYRLIRRLQIRALTKLLHRCLYRDYLVQYSLEFIPYEEPEKIPLYYQERYFNYDSLNTNIRFSQMMGQLVRLGYPQRDIPRIENYELASYLHITKDTDKEKIESLYHELSQKKVPHKRRILMSHIPFQIYDEDTWKTRWKMKKYDMYLSRLHTISKEEKSLLLSWIEKMKYPSL